MTWIMYFLIALTLGLIAILLLLVAIGVPKLKHHLDAQTRLHDDDEGA